MENKKTSLLEISELKVSGLKVSELKSLAKQFGLNRYSKLRKQELIQIVEERKRELIEESDRKRNTSSLLDESVPEIKIPILKPAPVLSGNKVATKVATLRSLARKMT